MSDVNRSIADRLQEDIRRVCADEPGADRFTVRLFSETEIQFHESLDGIFSTRLAGLLGMEPSPVVAIRDPEPELAEMRIANLAIHECSHWLQFGFTSEQVTEPTIVATAQKLRTLPNDWPDKSGQPACYRHEADFMRAAIHVYHRLQALDLMGYVGALRFVTDWQHNGCQADISTYAGLLRSEFDIDAPISQILKTDPPAEFIELWRNDRGIK